MTKKNAVRSPNAQSLLQLSDLPKLKRLFLLPLLGLVLLAACNANSSQKSALVSMSVCNDADQPLAEVYLNGNYAGGGNRAHGRSGSVCCSRLALDQPVTVEWEMSMYYSDPKPMPSYKVSVPVSGVLRTDQDNYLAIHVDEKGVAKLIVATEEQYFGPKGLCKQERTGVNHD